MKKVKKKIAIKPLKKALKKPLKKKRAVNYDKMVVIPMAKEMWRTLRTISFERGISMSELTRRGLQKIIDKYEL